MVRSCLNTVEPKCGPPVCPATHLKKYCSLIIYSSSCHQDHTLEGGILKGRMLAECVLYKWSSGAVRVVQERLVVLCVVPTIYTYQFKMEWHLLGLTYPALYGNQIIVPTVSVFLLLLHFSCPVVTLTSFTLNRSRVQP